MPADPDELPLEILGPGVGGGVTTGEAVTNFEVQKPRQGKMSDQCKRNLAFLLLHDMSIGTMPFRTE